MKQSNIRNIAIIAHVDHGKTTLVDHLLKQAHAFADHQAEMTQTTIMDSQDLERERGLTILAKNTAEGVLAQTKYVLSLAMKQGLKIIVLINKVDKKDQRSEQVLEEISNLFLEFAEHDSQLEFPVLYVIGREGVAGFETSENQDHSMILTDAKD